MMIKQFSSPDSIFKQSCSVRPVYGEKRGKLHSKPGRSELPRNKLVLHEKVFGYYPKKVKIENLS